MPAITLSSSYDGASSGNVISVTLHEARVLAQAGTGAPTTPAAVATVAGVQTKRTSQR